MIVQPEHQNHAFAPVYLPEVDKRVSWVMCRNPVCENFGHPFDPTSQTFTRRSISDDRYRIVWQNDRYKISCKVCGKWFDYK